MDSRSDNRSAPPVPSESCEPRLSVSDINRLYEALAHSWVGVIAAYRAKQIEVAAAHEDVYAGRGPGPSQELLREAERLLHQKEAERAKLHSFVDRYYGITKPGAGPAMPSF